jgi:hypothetical protein
MFNFNLETPNDHRVHKYSLTRDTTPLSYSEVLTLWQTDESFRALFISLLADSPFSAYRWETPPISQQNQNRPFEFVLLNSPSLNRPPDIEAYQDHFSTDEVNEGIVIFANLGKDATLVVPSPRTSAESYMHLASFMRQAPIAQQHALWRIVAETVQDNLSSQPLWLSTAGGGVAWLHVRLDSRPNYYSYRTYRDAF